MMTDLEIIKLALLRFLANNQMTVQTKHAFTLFLRELNAVEQERSQP